MLAKNPKNPTFQWLLCSSFLPLNKRDRKKYGFLFAVVGETIFGLTMPHAVNYLIFVIFFFAFLFCKLTPNYIVGNSGSTFCCDLFLRIGANEKEKKARLTKV